jgi:hypothetical protein
MPVLVGAKHFHREMLTRSQPGAYLLDVLGALQCPKENGSGRLAGGVGKSVTTEPGKAFIDPIDGTFLIQDYDGVVGFVGSQGEAGQFGLLLPYTLPFAVQKPHHPGKNSQQGNCAKQNPIHLYFAMMRSSLNSIDLAMPLDAVRIANSAGRTMQY